MPPRTGDAYWVASSTEQAVFGPLSGDAKPADTVVVGGGLVGVTTALLLQREGCSVALLEAKRLGRQVTGGSTGKVTSQHGRIYSYLVDELDRGGAIAYGRSNEAGLEWICRQVAEKSIDCELERCPAYLYTGAESRVADIEREARIAASLGLPASFERELSLPMGTVAAARFDRQAQFHPLRYLLALAREFASLGGRIHESTRVVAVERGRKGAASTVIADGARIRADDVVIATNLPILDRGGYFGRAFPKRHMCLATPVAAEALPPGMYFDIGRPSRSMRSAPLKEGGKRMLVAAGEAFPTGDEDTGRLLDNLENYVHGIFGATGMTHRWGNQDYYSADRMPYVGPVLPGSRRIRVATGFSAWGITAGTVAAMILADDILGRQNEWAPLYDSRRSGLRRGGRRIVAKNASVAGSWLAGRLRSGARRSTDSLREGEGGLARLDGKTVAAYRDSGGHLHAVAPWCTHLGCELTWNATETSWDCHCHGSRFDIDGRVMNGPAVRDLRRIRPSD